MSLRPPALGRVTPETALDLLEHEVAGEMASSLGRAGRRVEETLARLAAAEASDPMRPDLLADAADAVYWYFIQRELCGLRRHADVIREYGIPNAVLARLGAR
ncbi:MAG TPA: DUF6665 family protein [Mesorhizobium sp.]|jgi:hypothetical protein|nr:DUF6665 family protein [Mesorhizobium sp.]